MTLTQMQYFSSVRQYQNISMAAKMLYISQPALSSSLSDLEREVGFKLFDRKSKGIHLVFSLPDIWPHLCMIFFITGKIPISVECIRIRIDQNQIRLFPDQSSDSPTHRIIPEMSQIGQNLHGTVPEPHCLNIACYDIGLFRLLYSHSVNSSEIPPVSG